MTEKTGCEEFKGNGKTNCEACRKKFLKYVQEDPFEEILPSLLNPYDVEKYVDKVGIIYPFLEENLRTPTYKVPLYGDITRWDEEGKKETTNFSISNKGETVVIKPNSVTYVHISTIFRVPQYLAFRFNLTVSLAQKGLLLGTGPIVDPGYEGRIMIPIHNLTDNIYKLKGGSGFIKVEITKLSVSEELKSDDDYKYIFPPNGKHWTSKQYFSDINDDEPIRSSIPDAIRTAEKNAIAARKSSESAKKTVNTIRNLSLVALFAAIIALGSFLNTVLSTTSLIASRVEKKTMNNLDSISYLREEIKKLRKEIENNEKNKN